ncbi:ABC transporter ATP-binding protein [Aerococcaceae bacterium DSM 111176]|nr:ABC transporter ATP-binding protein [Aerococcaceae bacterium DSM 111176]
MLEVKDLQVTYGDFIAIDDVNITINKGDFFTLLGPSGCGKTTTLRAIAGFNKVSNGAIENNGENITHKPVEKRGFGMVFQSYALFPTMTVYENIAYGLEVDKKSKKEIDDTVHEMAKLVDLTDEQLQKNVSDLSGGQQQRVAIARALAKRPEIILFDEPLSNLDAKLRKQLRKELKRIQRETGLTAIYVTHDQEEALELSDQIAVFNVGRVEQIGTPKEIYDAAATEFVCNFIGEANKLGSVIMSEAHKQVGYPTSPNKNYYIREEKILFDRPDITGPNVVTLDATVTDITFQGSWYIIEVSIDGDTLRILNKNDNVQNYPIGSQAAVSFTTRDILAYEVN